MRKKVISKKKTLSSDKLTYSGETFLGYNRPKMTPNHPRKKAVVLAKVGDEVKMIRFGAQGYGHNYSPEARRSFKARHRKNIERGKLSAAYWADKFLWGGPGKPMQKPKSK
jgi:hypothetical protein